MSNLVTNPSQVEASAVRFPRQLDASPALQDRLPYARAWYAFPDGKGGWLYVPSKFGGYRDMTAAEYLDDSPRDGRRTEKQLSQWFVEVPVHTELHAELYDGLVAFLARYGKTPSTKARISVQTDLHEGYADQDSVDNSDSAIVDLMLLVAKKLPQNELSRLRNAL